MARTRLAPRQVLLATVSLAFVLGILALFLAPGTAAYLDQSPVFSVVAKVAGVAGTIITAIALIASGLRRQDSHAAPPPPPSASLVAASVEASVARPEGPPLPSVAPDFIGRREDRRRLASMLGAASTVLGVLVTGEPGVGKTQLVLKVAEELDLREPPIYLDLCGIRPPPLDSSETLRQLLNQLDPGPNRTQAKLAELQREWRARMNGTGRLVVLENPASAEPVRACLGALGVRVAVVSRKKLTVEGLEDLALGEMSPEDARALLVGIAPRIGKDADMLAATLGYLPLALRCAATRLKLEGSLSVASYMRQLGDARARIRALRLPADIALDVGAGILLSVDLLEEETHNRFRQLGVFPAPFETDAAAAVWNVETETARETLETLHHHSLARYEDASGRWSIHDVVRSLALAQLDKAGETGPVEARHAHHYVGVARRADDAYLDATRGPAVGLALFDADRAHIEAAWRWAAGAPRTEESSRILNDLPDAGAFVLALRLHRAILRDWLERAAGAARDLGDKRGESHHLGNLGNAHTALGEPMKAIAAHERALAISREIGDKRSEGADLANLGRAYADLGDARTPIQYYEQALALGRETGDKRGEANRLGYLGEAHATLGDNARALEFHERALALARAIADPRGESRHLGNVGLIHAAAGDFSKARAHHEEGLAIARAIGDRRAEGRHLNHLGLTLIATGNAKEAIDCFERSLTHFRETGDRRGEADSLDNLGIAHLAVGAHADAIRHHDDALAITRTTGDRRNEARRLAHLGAAHVAARNKVQARDFLAQALTIARQIEDPRIEAAATAAFETLEAP